MEKASRKFRKNKFDFLGANSKERVMSMSMNSIFKRIRTTSWIAVAILGLAFLTAALNVELSHAEEPKIAWNAETGQAALTTGGVELVVETKDGINAKSLRDTKSGQVFADRDYEWQGGGFPKLANLARDKKAR